MDYMSFRIGGGETLNLSDLRKNLEENKRELSQTEMIDGLHSMILSPKAPLSQNELHDLEQIVNYLSPGAEGLSLKKMEQIRAVGFDTHPERGELVGRGVVTELATGKPVTLEIRKAIFGHRREYTAYHNDEVLGSIAVYKFVKTERGYGADTDRTDTNFDLYGSFIPDLSIKIMVQI